MGGAGGAHQRSGLGNRVALCLSSSQGEGPDVGEHSPGSLAWSLA